MGIYTKKPSPSREQKCTSERAKENIQTCLFNDPSPTLNGLPTILSIFFLSASYFLLSVRFHQLALPAACVLLSDYNTPQRRGPPLSSSSVYPPTLVCLLPSWGAKSSLCLVISGLHFLFFFSFLPPKTRPMPPTLLPSYKK